MHGILFQPFYNRCNHATRSRVLINNLGHMARSTRRQPTLPQRSAPTQPQRAGPLNPQPRGRADSDEEEEIERDFDVDSDEDGEDQDVSIHRYTITWSVANIHK